MIVIYEVQIRRGETWEPWGAYLYKRVAEGVRLRREQEGQEARVESVTIEASMHTIEKDGKRQARANKEQSMVTRTGAFQVVVHQEHGQSLLNWAAKASALGFPLGRWPSKLLVTLPAQPQPEVVLFVHEWQEHTGAVHIYQSVDRPGERLTLTVFHD